MVGMNPYLNPVLVVPVLSELRSRRKASRRRETRGLQARYLLEGLEDLSIEKGHDEPERYEKADECVGLYK